MAGEQAGGTVGRRIAAKVGVFFVQLVLITLISAGLLELVVALSFRYPRFSPVPRTLLRYMHVQFDRNTIQVMPECAVFHERLTYTLKPGRCTFANREFRNDYRINSLGVRDDEASLRAPLVVMLGDSLTMGWGVEEEQAFPSVFERRTGSKTLNAGISSYGTARELRLLELIDRSALRDLVIQYSDNDLQENELYVTDPRWRTLTKPEYERTVEAHRSSLSYFPGKYALNMLVQLRNLLRDRVSAQESGRRAGAVERDREAAIFLQVLERSPVDLSGLRVTVISLDSPFVVAARRLAGNSDRAWIRGIVFVDLGGIAGQRDAFYVLDDHPTASGHAAIAQELIEALRYREGSSVP